MDQMCLEVVCLFPVNQLKFVGVENKIVFNVDLEKESIQTDKSAVVFKFKRNDPFTMTLGQGHIC